MKPYIVTSTLQRDRDSNWHYVHIPKEVRDDLKHYEKRGIIAVTARIGATTWDGSLMPWADGSAQITINAVIRKKESLTDNNNVTIIIVPRN